MNIKSLAASAALVSASFLAGNAAQATCTTYGQVEQYWTNGATCYAWVSPTTSIHPHPYYYRFATTDPEICDAIFNAKHQTGWISGNATTCPTSGTSRYGGIINSIYAH